MISVFQHLTLVRAMYRVEWLLMLNGTDSGLIGWLKTIEYLENRTERKLGEYLNQRECE